MVDQGDSKLSRDMETLAATPVAPILVRRSPQESRVYMEGWQAGAEAMLDRWKMAMATASSAHMTEYDRAQELVSSFIGMVGALTAEDNRNGS